MSYSIDARAQAELRARTIEQAGRIRNGRCRDCGRPLEPLPEGPLHCPMCEPSAPLGHAIDANTPIEDQAAPHDD